jgi:hypothetical protein
MRTIGVSIGERVDFGRAQQIALRQAARHLQEPMPLSWHDWKTGQGFPDVQCCTEDDCRPGWLEYGEARGGEVRIDVGEDFSFILRDGVWESD